MRAEIDQLSQQLQTLTEERQESIKSKTTIINKLKGSLLHICSLLMVLEDLKEVRRLAEENNWKLDNKAKQKEAMERTEFTEKVSHVQLKPLVYPK